MRLTLSKILCLILLSMTPWLSGCGGTRVIISSPHDDVRIAEKINARVYVKDKTGTWSKSKNKIQINEGDYLISGSALTK